MAIVYEGVGAATLNSTATTTCSVNYPAGIAAGDVLVLVVTCASASLPTIPSGWLAGGVSSSSGGNAPSERVMLKVATGTESGNLAVTVPSSTNRGVMLRFSGVDTTTPLDNAGSVTDSATATTTHVLPSITTTTTGCALIAVACANAPGGTWTPPTTQGNTWVEVHDTTGANPSTGIDYNIWSGSGATGTVSLTRSSNVRGCAGMIALRPAATDTPPGEGSASSSWSFTGTATGQRTPKGSASGALSWTGSATGKRSPIGTASGSYAFAGSATGTAPAVGSTSGTAAGSWALVGTATGKRSPIGSGSGAYAYAGTAVGQAVMSGTAAGEWTFVGSATGISTQPQLEVGNPRPARFSVGPPLVGITVAATTSRIDAGDAKPHRYNAGRPR